MVMLSGAVSGERHLDREFLLLDTDGQLRCSGGRCRANVPVDAGWRENRINALMIESASDLSVGLAYAELLVKAVHCVYRNSLTPPCAVSIALLIRIGSVDQCVRVEMWGAPMTGILFWLEA